MSEMSELEGVDVAKTAERLERMPTPSIYDVMDERGLGERCCLRHDVRPLRPGRHLAGPAFTVRWTRDPRTVSEWRPPGLDRISDYFAPIDRGDVVVVDGGDDTTTGHWGEMLSTMAWRRGARGVVVDGGTRDSEGIATLEGFEAFARYTTPLESMRRMRITDVDVPLMLNGAAGDRVLVRPGDWIVADPDAVLVLPREHLEEIVEAAEALEELEAKARDELRAGADFDEVFRKYGRA